MTAETNNGNSSATTGATAAAKKVLLIGWDAADWKVIEPLMEAGEMPNLQKLVDGGVMGNIATLQPVLSPMLWTSIATGKRAYKHGIHGFSEPCPNTGAIRPITNLSRSTKAVWNILNQNDKKCNVIGWWPSYPAEPLSGMMVADQFKTPPPNHEAPWPLRPGMVHPAELSEHVAPLRISPYELEEEHLLPFVPNAAKIDQEKDQRLVAVAKSIAECSSVHAVATAAMQLEPWDFMAVYYDAIDHFSHGFMKYHPPKQDHISDDDYEMFKDVVNSAYRYHDMMLGVLMHLAGEDTTIILMSDHGFHSDHLRPVSLPNEPAGPADEHRHHGILVVNGPGIKKDELVYGASLLDITPTILQLFGLPVGEDMDGKVLGGVFEREPSIDKIPSWDDVEGESGQHPADKQLNAAESQEAIDQLVALGYIEKPDENKEKAIAQTIRELKHNLARAYIGGGRHREAIEIYDKLWEKFPTEHRFGVKLIECHLALQQYPEARQTMTRLMEQKVKHVEESREELKKLNEELKDTQPDDYTEEQKEKLRKLTPASSTNLKTATFLEAKILRGENKLDDALERLQALEGIGAHHRADVFQQQGEIYLQLSNWTGAENAFEKALEVDPHSAAAYHGLCRSYLPQRKNRLAAQAAQRSLSLMFFNPRCHLHYGIALLRCRQHEMAIRAFETAIRQNPNFPAAHRRLAMILRNRFKDSEGAIFHERQAKFAEERIEEMKRERQEGGAKKPAILEYSHQDIQMQDSIGSVTADPSEVITIVSGLPRSGTSMMMQMLQAGGMEILTDEKRAADEDNPEGYLEFDPVKRLREDNSWLADAKGKVVKVIAQQLPFLPQDYQYRILFMDRDLREVLASQAKMLERNGLDPGEVDDNVLARTFIRQVNQVKRVLEVHPNIDLLNVSYHGVLESPAEVAASIAEFLRMNLDQDQMQQRVKPALHRNVVDLSPTGEASVNVSLND